MHLAAAATRHEGEQQGRERLLDLLAHFNTSVIGGPRSVHLAAEGDVHLAALSDMHLAGEAHVPSRGLKVCRPSADD